MGIHCNCPNGHKLNVKTEQAGKVGICPVCKLRFQIPFGNAPTPTSHESIAPSHSRTTLEQHSTRPTPPTSQKPTPSHVTPSPSNEQISVKESRGVKKNVTPQKDAEAKTANKGMVVFIQEQINKAKDWRKLGTRGAVIGIIDILLISLACSPCLDQKTHPVAWAILFYISMTLTCFGIFVFIIVLGNYLDERFKKSKLIDKVKQKETQAKGPPINEVLNERIPPYGACSQKDGDAGWETSKDTPGHGSVVFRFFHGILEVLVWMIVIIAWPLIVIAIVLICVLAVVCYLIDDCIFPLFRKD